jgi:hypothetical protein
MRSYFISSSNENANKQFIHRDIMKNVKNKSWIMGQLGEQLKIFKGDTESYWKDIEPKGKKCMVISMEAGNYVRNAGKFGEELSSNDINGAFVILDGIDYKSRNVDHELLYMEV